MSTHAYPVLIEPAEPRIATATPRLDAMLEILLIALLIFLPAAYGTVDAWSELVGFSIAGLVAVLLAVRQTINRERLTGRWIVGLPVMLFLLLVVLQLLPLPAGIVQSIAPHTHDLKAELLGDLPDAKQTLARMSLSFYTLATKHELRIVLLAVTVLATVIRVHRDPRRLRRLLIAIAIIAGGFALLAIAQDLTHTDRIYWLIYNGEPARSGPFANHSNFGQWMNASIGATIALLLMLLMSPAEQRTPRTWIAAALLGGVIALGWATIALSLTRGGMIAAFVAGTFAAVILLTLRHARRLVVVLVLVAVASVAMLVHFGAESVTARLVSSDLAGARTQMNRDIWLMSKQFPLVGTGLGTFERVYPGYDHTMALSTAAYADNDYLQLLAETGWIGVALAAFCVVAIWSHWATAARSMNRTSAAIAIGLGYSLVAVMIQSTTDFGQHLPANACLTACICGMLVNLGSADAVTRQTSRATTWIHIPIALALAAWMIVGAEQSRRADAHWTIARRTANALADEGWTGDALAIATLRWHADAAVDAEPGNAYFRYRRAVYRWRLATREFETGSPEWKSAARAAVDELNAARALCPTFGAIYTFLGQIEYNQLELPIGVTHIRLGAQLDRTDPTAWFAAGRVDALRGKYAEANEKFRHALALDMEPITDIVELYLDELREPQAALDLAWDNGGYLGYVANGLIARPEYKDLGAKAWARRIELLVLRARETRDANDLAGAARGSLELQQFEIAAELFKDAIQRDDSHVDWWAGEAEALMQLKRFDQSEQVVQVMIWRFPHAPETTRAISRLTEAKSRQ